VVDGSHGWDRERWVKAGVLGSMAALFLLALVIFVLPFAFPTPPPIITRFQSTVVFSPNGDGRRDMARVNLRVQEPSQVRLEIVSGGEVRATLLDDQLLPAGWRSVVWDGRSDEGDVLPDGEYGIRLRARSNGKRFNTSRVITIDTSAPLPAGFRVESATLGPPAPGECRINFTAKDPGTVLFEILRPGGTQPLAHRGPLRAPAGRELGWRWRGLVDGGGPVDPGLYTVRATLADAAGNRSERERTCWVGRLAGAVTPARPAAGTPVTLALRRTGGEALPPATPVILEFRRRTGVPGRTATPPLGPRVGERYVGPAGRARITTPAGIRPSALWLTARTADGRSAALIRMDATP
jgi:hypothetical protein